MVGVPIQISRWAQVYLHITAMCSAYVDTPEK